MQDNQMGKEIIEIGNVSADNKRRHQSGVVLSRGGGNHLVFRYVERPSKGHQTV